MPGQYRTEHVAEAPKRWKVRTVTKGTHLVRLAFPPGKRKKGSGKLIEILHPVNENPCAMSEGTAGRVQQNRKTLLREVKDAERAYASSMDTWGAHDQGTQRLESRWRDLQHAYEAQTGQKLYQMNPGEGMEAAADLSREFHGTDPRQVITMQETDVTRKTYTALGDLVELWIRNVGGDYRTSKISFTGDRVKVASAPNGAQLYLIGGNQNIDSHLDKFGGDVSKDFVELGQAVYISYATRKKMDDLKWTEYYHRLGEETHEPPLAFYNRLQRRIFLVGGRYRVEAPGIIN